MQIFLIAEDFKSGVSQVLQLTKIGLLNIRKFLNMIAVSED